MELTEIIKKKITKFYVDEYGKEPHGVQIDMAVKSIKAEMVGSVLSGCNWKQFIPGLPTMEKTNE